MKICTARFNHRVRGFTLIEMVTVIVLVSILAVMGSKFIAESTKSYQSTQTRSKLFNMGRQAVEQMSRQLRNSMPYSIRVTNSNTCIEFMPIAGGGNYLNPVPDSVNLVTAASTIAVAPHSVDFGAAYYVSIGPLNASELYGVSPLSMASLSSRTSTLLTLSAAKSWKRNSVGQRFYILDKPQGFCIVGGQLRSYAAQDPTSTGVDTASSYTMLADSISGSSPFSLTTGSENRNTNVQFNLTFSNNGESVLFNQSVMIRNVP